MLQNQRKYIKRTNKTFGKLNSLKKASRLELLHLDFQKLELAPPVISSQDVSSVLTTERNVLSRVPFVLDQGMQGTCVANSMAYQMYISLGPTSRAVGGNLLTSPNVASRCALQYAENFVMSGLNPMYIAGNPLLTDIGINSVNFDNLFTEGSWFSIAASAAMCVYIAPESVWNYPANFVTDLPHFYFPLRMGNPLLTAAYTPATNGKFSLSSANLYSANYGSYIVNTNSFSANGYAVNSSIFFNLIQLYIREVTPLVYDDATVARQKLLLNFIDTALASNRGVGISFLVTQEFEDIGSDGLYLPSDSVVNPSLILGGHAVTIVGTIKGSTLKGKIPTSPNLGSISNTDWYFVVLNSWGTSWGNNGLFYLRVLDFLSMTVDDPIPGYVNTLFTQAVISVNAASK